MWWLGTAWAGIALSEDAVPGDEVTVTLTDDFEQPVQGATVRVIYRPGLTDSSEVAVGITDARGQVSWTPDQAGTATLIAGDQELPLALPWADAPAGSATVLVLLVAACLASAGYALWSPAR
ncbi:MAG: hypothetical protein EP330_15430 [Deltaproteobacteria bacterium]|nr:MAG: hypothetical protein EP330_15430 [Deltaproteobacteria bacterium]